MSPEGSTSVWNSAPDTHPLDNEEEVADDPVEFLLQPSSTPDNPGASRVLEVGQVVGDTVVDLRSFPRSAEVKVADRPPTVAGGDAAPLAPFAAPREALFDDEVTLFRPEDARWIVCFHERWGGFVVRGEARVSLAELTRSGAARRTTAGIWEYPLAPAERVVLHVGPTTFVGREATPARRLVARLRDEVDHAALAIALFIGITAALVGTALGFVPPPPTASANNLEDHAIDLSLFRHIPPPAPTVVSRVDESAPAAGPRAAGPEGRRGGGNPAGNRPRPAGLLDVLDHNPALAGLRSGSLDGGLVRGIQRLIGSSGASDGPGLGWRGDGVGGGGTARDAGLSFGNDRGSARNLAIGVGGRKTEAVIPGGDDSVTLGNYNKSLIDEVIKRNLSAIRYCYQRELTKNPALGGKVTVKFTIGRDGAVSSALTRSSTLGSPAVESCINGRFFRMNFPAPEGGGIVVVSYPFMFSSS